MRITVHSYVGSEYSTITVIDTDDIVVKATDSLEPYNLYATLKQLGEEYNVQIAEFRMYNEVWSDLKHINTVAI